MTEAIEGQILNRFGHNRGALEQTIASDQVLQTPRHAALVALCRDLADEMDGPGGARVVSAYLSALKDVGRAIEGAKGTAGRTRPAKSAEATPGDKMAEMRARRMSRGGAVG